MAGTLYDKGYDVHMFAHNQIQSTGRGAAYDEVVSAVLNRNVDNVAIFGYSWGGGATYELSQGLSTNTALRRRGTSCSSPRTSMAFAMAVLAPRRECPSGRRTTTTSTSERTFS